MLTSDEFDFFVEPIVSLYEDYSDTIILDIVRRIKKMGGLISETSAWQAQRLIESGRLYEEVLIEISKLTGISRRKLAKMFQEAGVRSIEFDDSIYKAAGLEPLPLNLSPQMQRVLLNGLQKTNGSMLNLTMTTALSAQQSFLKYSDLAYQQVVSGAMSYDQAIKAAVKGAAGDGLFVQYPTGHRDRLDVAIRRAVLTGVSQTVARMQDERAAELGSDLVQMSAHIGARPSHQAWQGRIFSLSGTSNKYPPFVQSTGYGTGDGFAGWNCRHSRFPYFEGLSEAVYKKAELDRYAAKEVNTPKGKKPVYEATQIQRAIERKIRYWKREAMALEEVGIPNSFELSKVKEWQARMRSFISKTNFTREYSREGV
jgi:hypothetical protein